MTDYNDKRDFLRGQVFFVDFSGEKHKHSRPSRVIQGAHRAVVLFDSTFPRNTVVVVPISSLYEADGTKKETISSDVILNASEYPSSLISDDSFIMTNQIQSVTRSRLERHVGKISDKDMIKLDILLISTLSLSNTIQLMIEEEVSRRLAELGYIAEDEEA